MNEQRIAILTDTGTNTPADFMAAHDIRAVALRINFSDGTSYRSGEDISAQELVARLSHEVPSTSLPSPEQIREALEQAHADGYERAVFVTVSAGLSATNQTVHMVAEQMEGFPVLVINTRSIGPAAGLVVMAAAQMVEEGVPFEHLERRLDELSRQTRVFFSTKCDKAGYCAVANKARGWKRSLDTQVTLAVKHATTLRGAVRLVVACSEGNDHFDELEAKLRTQLASKGIEVVEPVVRSAISPDLLVHSGPDVVTIGVQPDWH